jgi:hypothetical protein
VSMASGLKPPRTPWAAGFPDVVLHAGESAVKKHSAYWAAKTGNEQAARLLVSDLASVASIDRLHGLVGERNPLFASAHAFENQGINAIPETLAHFIAQRLACDVASAIFQTNRVGHTGANGYIRLARQAAFEGPVEAGRPYVLVDDFIGQGGTLANLKGHVEINGGIVICATALTGRADSAIMALRDEQLAALRRKHGQLLEDWWRAEFGHGFDELTNSEARYLERSADADIIRARLLEAQAD